VTVRLLRRGDSGSEVVELKRRLTAIGTDSGPQTDDDVFDDACDLAVRHFQQARGLSVDGVVGPGTWTSLEEAAWQLGDRVLQVASPLLRGDDVTVLQHRLLQLGFAVGRVDGFFGPVTAAALAEFQSNMGLPADGVAGPSVFKALERLAPVVSGGRADALRDHERLREAGPRLAGKLVVIDPSRGGDDPGARVNGLAEADIMFSLATTLADRLAQAGVSALLTRDRGSNPDAVERAKFANSHHADVLLSLHVDRTDNEAANGVATYFYGSDWHPVRSVVGERLAELINKEICARTRMGDNRSHPKSWDILRFTTMPAVQVDLGYLGNAGDAGRLAEPQFLDDVAEAIVVAIQRLYLTGDDDAKTGYLTLAMLGRAGG
jgi:N-acetylmuramoyl-L-alanine amidase